MAATNPRYEQNLAWFMIRLFALLLISLCNPLLVSFSNVAGVEKELESPPCRTSRKVSKKRAKETAASADASRQASCP